MATFTTRAISATNGAAGFMTCKDGEDFCYSTEKADADAIAHMLNIDPQAETKFWSLSDEQLAAALAFAALFPA